MRAKQAAVRTADRRGDGNEDQMDRRSHDGERETTAGLRGATTQRGYAELRATVDGVITSRLISPGGGRQFQASGSCVSQISLSGSQANVAESDLPRIRKGSLARVFSSRQSGSNRYRRDNLRLAFADPGRGRASWRPSSARIGSAGSSLGSTSRWRFPSARAGGSSLVVPASAVERSVEPRRRV